MVFLCKYYFQTIDVCDFFLFFILVMLFTMVQNYKKFMN